MVSISAARHPEDPMAASRDFAAHPLHTAAAVLLATLASAGPVEAAMANQEILISGGTVVTSEGRFDADVRVRDGTIVEIGTGLAAGAGARTIDATGLLVMPGGVDPHVHLGGRTRDDYRTGSQAALAGGITTISNFAFPAGEQNLAEAIEREAALIREHAIADVILHAGITPRTEQAEMTTLGAETGQTSTKIFMVWTTFDAAVPNHMATMDAAGRAGILTMVHCEDWPILAHAIAELTAAERTSLEYFPDSRPVLAEVIACQRAVAMAEATGAPIYAVHVSSEGALRVLREARDRGLDVFVETRPIYLHFTRERFEGPDRGLYVGQPPLREQGDQDALWAGIASGSVHVLATDHVAYRREEKMDPSQTISSHRAGLSNLQVVRPDALFRGRRPGTHLRGALRGGDLDQRRQALRALPAQGHDRRGLGRRHRPLGSGRDAHHPRRGHVLRRRFLGLLRLGSHRLARDDAAPRRSGVRERRDPGGPGQR